MILKAISDCLLVSLNSIVVDFDDALEALQCYEANVIFPVHEESSEDVDS